MKKILFITTGGTIACVSSDHGLKPGQDGKQILAGIEKEIRDEKNIDFSMDIFDLFSLDSTNIGPQEWIQMITLLNEKMDEYDGFVVTHGTDTMAYSSAAVSMGIHSMGINNKEKPIIFTGSQIPMGEARSDAKQNLKDAIIVALENKGGVFVCFAGKIIFGNCAKKTHSKDFEAFESIGCDYAGFVKDNVVKWNTMDCIEKIVNITRRNSTDTTTNSTTNSTTYTTAESTAPTNLFHGKVGCIKLLPGANSDIIDSMVSLGYQGIIIEAFGSGNVPNKNNSIFASIKNAISKGIKVAIISQCPYDGTDLTLYEMGRQALEIEVIDAKEMTVEALSVKMMYELGK